MMKSAGLVVLLGLATSASATILTLDNYDFETEGMTVFIRFYAPWCEHSKAMEEDWDELIEEFEDSPDKLVAEVDCIDTKKGGATLCELHGIKGFPTLKWGDPLHLSDYKGDRDLESLRYFAKEHLKPVCSVRHIELCDDEMKAKINLYQEAEIEELEAELAVEEKKIDDAEEKFKIEVERFHDAYRDLVAEKEKAILDIKDGGLLVMKSVRAHHLKDAKLAQEAHDAFGDEL